MTWGESLPFWVDMALAIGAVATAFLAVTALSLRLGLGLRWLTVRAAAIIRQAVEDVVRDTIRPIEAQLSPNGGTSLRDSVTRIETSLSAHVTGSEDARQAINTELVAWKAHSDRQFEQLWSRIGDVPIDEGSNVPPPPHGE